jgi:cytoskeletal protein CcmA (bactofilin family)
MEIGKPIGTNSVLSKKVKMEGDIHGEEDLRVEGHFKGTIKVTGDIFVGQSGVVEADVEADNIVIQGKVTGNVMARKQLEIQSSGQLLGDCRAKSIDIREGAIFEGRSSMLKPPAAPPATGAKPDTATGGKAKINPKQGVH